MAAPGRVKPGIVGAFIVVVLFALIATGLFVAAAAIYAQEDALGGAPVALAVIGVAFSAASLACARYAMRQRREFAEEERRRAEFPNEPWKWRKEWCDPIVTSRQGAGVSVAWFIAVFVCAISTPAAYMILTEPNVPKGAYVALIFPVIGAILLANAVYQTLQWRKYGSPRLVLTTVPGSIGGYLGGVIEVPATVRPEHDVTLVLQCIRRVTTGSGKNRHTTETALWEREERFAAERWTDGGSHGEIPVLFHIPPGQPSTNIDDPNDQLVWRLSARAEVAGIDFKTRFDVPVFATGETAEPPPAGGPALDVYRPQAFGPEELAKAGITRDVSGWKFNPPNLWLPRLLSGLVALALTAVLWLFVGNSVHWMLWALVTVFALVAWVGAADLWFARSELRIDPEDVVVRQWRWSGVRERRITRANVAEIRAIPGMQLGTARYHQLLLVGREGPGTGSAPQFGARATELGGPLRRPSRLEMPFAKHVRGSTLVAALRQMIEADIRLKR